MFHGHYAATPSSAILLPKTNPDPLEGLTNPNNNLIVVLLPAPLEPRKPQIEPLGTAVFSLLTTYFLP
jgi:hypothetical protein